MSVTQYKIFQSSAISHLPQWDGVGPQKERSVDKKLQGVWGEVQKKQQQQHLGALSSALNGLFQEVFLFEKNTIGCLSIQGSKVYVRLKFMSGIASPSAPSPVQKLTRCSISNQRSKAL